MSAHRRLRIKLLHTSSPPLLLIHRRLFVLDGAERTLLVPTSTQEKHLVSGMAEIAAKIRAKFKRRHSAIAGIPSLLSRSSVRSSGSHSSSLVRSSSYHSHGAAGHHDDSAQASPLTVPKSRAGSSHVSVIDLPEQDVSEHTNSPPDHGAHFNRPIYDPQEQGPAPPTNKLSDQSSSNDDNLVLKTSSASLKGAATTDVTTQNGLSPIAAALTTHLTSGPAPAPAAAPGAAAEPPTAAMSGPASDTSGNDLPLLSLRKLSSINEHPSPDQEPKKPPVHQQTPAIDAPSSAAGQPSNAAAPILPAKRDEAKPELVAPRTPKLATPSTSRPLHIALPLTSFGPPSASNLSPHAIYGVASNTAPSSPLRHSTTAQPPRPAAPIRRQSLLSNRQSTLIQTLLRGAQGEENPSGLNTDQLLSISGNMVTRKIWVKRPSASATLVTINEDDVVDDVRDMILRKYANSLGRQFDAPDLTLRIRPHGNQQERMLSPEEPMARTLDAYFPGGQSIEDALIIDVPLRRTPRASPRSGPPHAPHIQYYVEDRRPPETANDYFGPGAVTAAAHVPVTVTAPSNGSNHPHAIAVLNTGQLPQVPSPGGTMRARNYRERPERPRLGRQHTSSPTLINLASGATHQGSIATAATVPHGTHPTHTRTRSRTHSETSDQSQTAPQPPPIPTPPAAEASTVSAQVSDPPPRVSSPMNNATARPKKVKKNTERPSLPKGMLNGSVPPINVLIVEDNIINLKLLEAFVKRLKVRWSTAMNGRDAVNKWRDGGFHLVLMDIQLPVMSGLDATREIRRLERVNSIGVFSSAASTAPEEVKDEPDEKDKLENMDLFKSPVIIVALTASSLQSDRHEALAAGCNDFLTKVCAVYQFLALSSSFLCVLWLC